MEVCVRFSVVEALADRGISPLYMNSNEYVHV